MSVYTVVERAELVDFLKNYAIGELVDHQGISSGIENTNYFATTTEGEYVLTLFEELSAEELPYFLEIMSFLAQHKIPSARPIANLSNQFLSTLNNRPAAIVEKLSGSDTENPNAIQCAVIGKTMAQLHLASQQLTIHRDNSRGANWRQQMGEKLMPLLDGKPALLLQGELAYQKDYNSLPIPSSVIHADLFRDNALFSGNQLSGIIDFYYACNDYLMYDIAVAVNDWCVEKGGTLDRDFTSFPCLD
jgi:homoserine kinase type II